MQLNRNHASSDPLARESLVLTGSPLALEQFELAARGEVEIALSSSREVVDRVRRSRELVEQAVQRQDSIYGVTTGFGGMANAPVPAELADQLQNNLLNFLSAGVGEPIDPRHVRGAMLARANMLLRGHSGIRLDWIDRLVCFLQADAVPVVREHGSIGASGDLVPLAAIARSISGKGPATTVELAGESLDSSAVLARLGLEPLELKSKEGLALVNGTSFSAAIAANALMETRRLFVLGLAAHGMFLRALLSHEQPFDPFVHDCKPHPGQQWVAGTILEMISRDAVPIEDKSHPVQDRYSIRCLPQYLGPLAEKLAQLGPLVETELNGISDNPLVDVEGERLVQSGNFLGQSIGIGMDELRRVTALTAKHLDVQIGLLVAPEFNGGLSASLKGNEDNPLNMGLKGLQIAGNSIVPMLVHQAAPLVEHFPTHAEQFNQNVNGLSWGSANLAWKSVNLFADYLAIALLFAVQATDLRTRQLLGDFDGRRLLGSALEPVYRLVLETIDVEPGPGRPLLFDDHDRCLEQDVAKLAAAIKHNRSFADIARPALTSFEQTFGIG